MRQEAEFSLLHAAMLLQSIVLSCIDRKRFPFTRTQISILTVLATEGELTMKQAAKQVASSQEQATRAVAPLCDAGYVERRTDPANRTRVYIHLTGEGNRLFDEYWEILKNNLSLRLKESLTAEEETALCKASSDLVRLMEKVRLPDEKKPKARPVGKEAAEK